MSWRPDNWRQVQARNRDNPINRRPPTRWPYLEELMRDPLVMRALDRAWRNTNADVIPITAAVEQGGWIYMDMRTGQLTIIRKPNELRPPLAPGRNAEGAFHIRLDPPAPAPNGSCLVAIFHTHPSEPFAGPSEQDTQLAPQQGVPGIIRGRGTQYSFTGFERRADAFANGLSCPGFPR